MEPKAKKNNTLKKIIKSAKHLFLENGFNGTSIRDIAKKANVQSSLIYHYFSNKVELWKTVKESLINSENFTSINDCIKQDTFESFVKKLVEARFNIHASNPDMLKILDWQRLEKNSSLAGIKNQQNFASYRLYRCPKRSIFRGFVCPFVARRYTKMSQRSNGKPAA